MSAERPGEFRAEVAEPGLAGGQTAATAGQIVCPRRERPEMVFTAPDQETAGIVVNVHPLMEIEGDRIGALDPIEGRGDLVGEHPQAAESAIDVHPEPELAADAGHGPEVVDRAGIRGPGGGHHTDPVRALRSIAAQAVVSASTSMAKSRHTGMTRRVSPANPRR